jgi:hypothetical protein
MSAAACPFHNILSMQIKVKPAMFFVFLDLQKIDILQKSTKIEINWVTQVLSYPT